MKRWFWRSALSGAIVMWSASSQAQAPSNEAAAEALFNEGRALVEAGKIAEGCKKLEASQTLDAGTGTLLHLADCYERSGRTATAWARFREASARAAREGRADWETIAKTRARELEPKLAKVRIDAPPGVTVSQDGVEIPAAALGSDLPTDPGSHTLRAVAKGKRPWSQAFAIEAAKTTNITVPALAAEPPSPSDPPKSNPAFPTRTVGYGLGAAGVAGLALGAITGGIAISLNNKAKEVCPDPGVCADRDARDHADSARSTATISTIGFVAGGALLASGVLLVVLSPPTSAGASGRIRVGPQAISLEATF